MRKLRGLGIFVAAIAFVFGTFAVTNTNAQGALNEVLSRMENHKNALQSLEADVTRSDVDALLGADKPMVGTTFYLPGKGRDAYIRINWTRPNETLVVKDGKYILYRPELEQAIVGKVSNADKNTKTNNAFDFFNMSKSELKKNYKVQMLPNKILEKEEVWHLKLVPQTKKSYQYAELWVDGNGMPIQAKIVQKNNDSTTIRLTNVKKNIVIEAAVFSLKLPKGTKVIDG